MKADPIAPTTELARREPRITCLLADPDVGRAALARRYLSGRGIAVIGTPTSAGELVTLAELYRPNVVVVEDQLAPEQAHTLTRVLSSRAQRSAIIVATNGGDRDFLIQALDAGARGVLSRRAPLRDLVRAIEIGVRRALLDQRANAWPAQRRGDSVTHGPARLERASHSQTGRERPARR